jgi:DNA (cytosine-5)-methyltransferase 1
VSNVKPISTNLFAEGFGLDLGIEQPGFQTVSVVEIDSGGTNKLLRIKNAQQQGRRQKERGFQ